MRLKSRPSRARAAKSVAPPAVRGELRQQAGEERRHLGVAEIADHALAKGHARQRAGRAAGCPSACGRQSARRRTGMAARSRLHAEPDQIGRAGILDGEERAARKPPAAHDAAGGGERPDGEAGGDPIAVARPPARPPSKVLRMVIAVSGPGVVITSAEMPIKAGKDPVTWTIHRRGVGGGRGGSSRVGDRPASSP